MDFLDVGAGELLLILIVALLVLGPGKIVEVARELGKIVRSIRKASSDFTTQITRELEEEKKTGTPTPPQNKQ
ncbi:MAG: twin-arginine translocase TatA/TatE family subunit [Chloroflexi bacterium]|nr:twin-arginine translocase TatA/TatE family subunit [Chloroflexota bacterium]